MNKRITIRQEKETDHIAIYFLNESAFKRDDESKLIERLRLSDEFIPDLSLVAENDEGILVGHILFTLISIEGEQSYPSLALAPMAVMPKFQQSGIGSLLVKAGLRKAQELGHTSVIVLGHKDYYPRFGFEAASKWGIKCPFEVPEQVFMALELSKDALKDKEGTVKYSAAFNASLEP